MNKTITLCCIAAAAFVMTYSCSNRKSAKESRFADHEEQDYYKANRKITTEAAAPAKEETDSTAPHSLSSIAAQNFDKDGMKFIRTADIRFQVDNVPEATYAMEDITTRYGGFVIYTALNSTVNNKETVPISSDSSLDITYYTVENDITLRVPNTRMDSALRAMTALVGFLDHRIIRADEVSGQQLANDMSAHRNEEHARNMLKYMDQKQVKSADITEANAQALLQQAQADDAKIANRTLDNQIKYSTLHFLIYQRESVRKVKVANETNISRYRPSLLIQVRDAAVSGWEIVSHVLVFLVQCWAFILIGVLGWLIYRRSRKG
ncbi:MAG: hypothetical protein JWO03_2275 [Bacteroidetes bacterium]|nr:hypothetical protein [Bacteroidota bacterium]